ncbi:MAG: DsbA family protein [Betaproteobacteria bacterium]
MSGSTRWLAIAAGLLLLAAGSSDVARARPSSVQAAPAASTADPRTLERGPENARVTIVEFADFTSEASARLAFMLEALSARYPDDVRVVFRHNVDQSRPDAVLVHEAALAAAAQGRFWEMADLIFSNQNHLQRADLERMAGQLGLDAKRFDADLDSQPYDDVLLRDRQEAASAGVRDVPTCMLNGRRFDWPLTLEQLKKAVAGVLANPY